MSKLIFSTGNIAKKPYIFSCSKVQLYSMDELNYFLYNNIYLIDEDTFDQSLADWISMELGLPEVAEKVRVLLLRRNNIKDIVVSILCSADYYMESEIRSLIQVIDQIERLPLIKKSKIKADNFLALAQYTKAAKEYEAILESNEAAVFTQEEYGDIYHNLAVAKARTVSTVEASKYFLIAYKRNKKEESKKQYLYTLLLSKRNKEYEQACVELGVTKEEMDAIEEAVFEQQVAALDQVEYKLIEQLDHESQGKKTDKFYNEVNAIITRYKENYRKGTA